MEMMILNLDIGFPCPSLSIQTTVAKENLDPTTNMLDPSFTKRILMKCPFIVEVELFHLPGRFIKERQINPWFLRGELPEVQSFLKELAENERAIIDTTAPLGREVRDESQTIITLLDAFKVVDRMKYPVLWDHALIIVSYTPTSVSCEQSFSILKRRLHENMKKENGFLLVEMAKEKKIIELL